MRPLNADPSRRKTPFQPSPTSTQDQDTFEKRFYSKKFPKSQTIKYSMSPFGCVRSVLRPGALASISSKCPAVLLHRVNTNNWRPSNKLKGGQKCCSTFVVHLSPSSSKGVFASTVDVLDRPCCTSAPQSEDCGSFREDQSSSCRHRQK